LSPRATSVTHSKRFKQLVIGGTICKVEADVLPGQRSIAPEGEYRRLGDASFVFVPHAVGLDHGTLRVTQQREWQQQLVDHREVVVDRVDRDSHCADPLGQKAIPGSCVRGQLPVAVWSPIAAIEDEDERPARQVIGESPAATLVIRQLEVRQAAHASAAEGVTGSDFRIQLSPTSFSETVLRISSLRACSRNVIRSAASIVWEHNWLVAADLRFLIEPDARARDWLDAHHDDGPRIIAFDVTRGRRGVRICMVEVRERSPKDAKRVCVTAALDDGTRIFIDRRAAERLPRRFGLTVRGVGSQQHLDLDLTGEEWGLLLYD